MHTKEQIGAVIDSVNNQLNQCFNELPIDEATLNVTAKITALFSQLIGVIKTVIQERNIE